MRLGGGSQKRKLSGSPVPSPSCKARAKKAIGAVAASMLTAAYHMIATGAFYRDLGADHFDRRTKPGQIKRLIAKLQNLGYEVEVKPAAA